MVNQINNNPIDNSLLDTTGKCHNCVYYSEILAVYVRLTEKSREFMEISWNCLGRTC